MAQGPLLQIVGGKVIDPAAQTEYEADILIQNGKIARVDKRWLKPSVTLPGTEVFHVHGAAVAPALWDIHVHLREPGQEHKETMATGAQAAVRGGVGRMFVMPNTEPAIDNEETYKLVEAQGKAQEKLVDIEIIAAVTKGREGAEPTDLYRLRKLGAAAFSDDGAPVKDAQILRAALDETSAMDSLVIDHCEEGSMIRGGAIHEGRVSRSLGVPGIPRESEAVSVFRDIQVLKNSRGRLHLAHLSTKEAVELVRKAKKNGLAKRLTCEVCPHHFALTEEAVRDMGPLAKVNPPLRTEDDVKALHEAIIDGTVDAIASDHAPHSDWEKNQGLLAAPFGMIGLETMLPVTITYLVRPGIISLLTAIELLTTGPARIMNRPAPKIEPGEPADFVIFYPDRETTFRSFASKSRNSPFLGRSLYGSVLATLHRGQMVYRNESL
ncbi:MAG: dihydroorotase [Elusimicrobia bacterium]|nr:dihydroorotase [Elusimicrobiota bacterium]